MKKIVQSIVVLVVAVTLVKCSSNDFQISKSTVGKLNSKTTIKDLDNIFANDSIVKILSEGAKGDNYFQDDDEYRIYKKGGEHLLTIVPNEPLDSTSTIKSVQIFSSQYQTKSGLNINSTFEEINLNNTISKVETSFSSATLFIDEINTTIAIDKEELGLKDFGSQKVTVEQIPNLAKIKSFIVWFN